MRDSERRHHQAVPVIDGRGFSLGHVDHADIEAHGAIAWSGCAGYVAPFSSECGPERRERAVFLVEQTTKECREIGRGVVAGRTDDGQWFLSNQMTLPKERGQIGDVIGMEMTHGD